MSRQDIERDVRVSLEAYFADLAGSEPHGLYDMMIGVVEKPLLEAVMVQANQNQSRAAQWLGLNRNTLRKKLIQHRLLD
jgi:Fis family transcriptional regulator, factor for inversion stimulation protein